MVTTFFLATALGAPRLGHIFTDPRQDIQTIGVIAYRAGFGDLYSNRSSRRAFGRFILDIVPV
jgi:hypothetical protein